MRSLLNFLDRYSNIIIFIFLEVVAIYMLATSNGYHNIKLSNKLKASEAFVEKRISGATEYFDLRNINQILEEENLQLKNRLENVFRDDEQYFTSIRDTLHKQQYTYTRARAINQSVNKQKNFITLNKGINHGVEEGMAVVGPKGIIGTVVGTSKNYSIVMSVLNLDFRLSAQFRKNKYFGSLSWDGVTNKVVSLNEIPHHVDIQIGDTIETSSFSSVFPAGQLIGIVAAKDDEGGDFFKIDVKLTTDFYNISYVYIVGNLRKNEQLELENIIEKAD